MQITVQNIGGTSLGPFDIYYDTYAPGFLVASNVSAADLAAGYNVNVTNVATTLIVVNNRPGCGNVQQTIALPTPTTPTVYRSVTVSARMAAPTATPTTASVYYMINSTGYNYLGEFSTDSCEVYASIPVPDLSTLFLGIITGSRSVTFGATGSNYLCSNLAISTNFCGITIPYTERITGDTTISLQAKTTTPPVTIITCGITPTPPGPIPPPVVPATLTYSGTNAAQIQFNVERLRSGSPDAQIISLRNVPIPTSTIDDTTIPNIQPGDVLTISLTSIATPTPKGVVLTITNMYPTGDVQLYRTVGYTTTDTYQLAIQSGGVYTVTIEDFI
jgi:hypothetical protein